MVNITFKNVGQGDSIILEWFEKDLSKYAIVDCNIYQNKNPILQHIIDFKIKEIEFLLLTHPHSDHFSGFYDLLVYCRKNGIKIKRFLHTSEITPDYLKTATRSLESEEALFLLFDYLKEMRNKDGLILNTVEDNADLKIPLSKGYILEVLAPSSVEKDKYVKGVNFPFDEEDGNSNPNANWLSTILKISNEYGFVLLTADVESTTLTRIVKSKGGRIGNGKLLMAQLPHHGSKKNLNKPFWRMRKRVEVTPIVISVGKNGYKHPSQEVIEFFNKNTNYKIVSTNIVGSLSKDDERSEVIRNILNIVSQDLTEVSNGLHSGDKEFTFDGSTCTIAS